MITFPYIGGSIKSETLSITTGSVFGLTGIPGQLGINVRYISGGSLEIGGASLSAGNGFLLPNSNIPHFYVPITGTLYFVSTTATGVATIERIISEGNPGNVG